MWPFKKGSSGFSSSSTAEQVTNGLDGSGLTAIITGCSSGIGAETARVLALRGVHIVMAVRNLSAGNQVKESVIKETPNAKVDVMELDLSSLASVRNFASEFTSSCRPLNLLINNAGVFALPFTLSKDKIEMQFATNHLGHFLLTNLLLDTMKKTALESKREGRIVIVASELHRYTYKEGVCFDKLDNGEGYGKWPAYGQSKLANILYANELARRLKEEGAEITVNTLHPGLIATNLFNTVGVFKGFMTTFGRMMLKNVPQGAATTCYLALHPQCKGISGEYFQDNNKAKASAFAGDKDLAKKLWDVSVDLTKIS